MGRAPWSPLQQDRHITSSASVSRVRHRASVLAVGRGCLSRVIFVVSLIRTSEDVIRAVLKGTNDSDHAN